MGGRQDCSGGLKDVMGDLGWKVEKLDGQMDE